MKKLRGFSYVKSMANFEAFHWNFSSSTNPQIVRSVQLLCILNTYNDMILTCLVGHNSQPMRFYAHILFYKLEKSSIKKHVFLYLFFVGILQKKTYIRHIRDEYLILLLYFLHCTKQVDRCVTNKKCSNIYIYKCSTL